MKKHNNTHLGICILMIGLAAGLAQAQHAPHMISYQGMITASGEPFDGTGYFKFALVDDLGEIWWCNDGNTWMPEPARSVEIAVENGLFMVMLGDTAIENMDVPIETADMEHLPQALLRIWFSEDDVTFTLLSPDQPLASAPYALMVADLPNNFIGGQHISSEAVRERHLLPGAVTAAKLAADSVTGTSVQNGSITSNKLDWTTMPDTSLRGYAENGTFATAPVATDLDTIAMGFGARAQGNFASVGGGYSNRALAGWARVGGGVRNTAGMEQATVGGGFLNTADGIRSTIAGGYTNTASGQSATVGGGEQNTASGDQATVGGGGENTASGGYATVGGGDLNAASTNHATVGGGWGNTASGIRSTVGGGWSNTASGSHATVGGGDLNAASINHATVGGGRQNTASGIRSTVGGGWSNTASGSHATVGGGYFNTASTNSATVGGGQLNTASGIWSTVGGGWSNTAGTNYATVGGGAGNTASGQRATVAGGRENIASGYYATVGGGVQNTASGRFATVGGGYTNTASGEYATIPGGRFNTATNDAFAAGRRAKANHEGSFVWADSTNEDIASTNNNSVTFRCNGGVRFTSGAVGGNQTVAWAPGAGSWSFTSDRTTKEGFVPVDTHAVLEKVAALPLTEWNYVGYEQRHIGPMAQDFHAAFPLAGSSDTSINSLHLDGVALAAIQGLYAEVTRLRQEATAWHGSQKSEFSRLQAENAELKARLERLEAMLGARAQ